MLEDIALISAGFILLVWGADRLIAGASATASNLGVSPLVIGLVVVGFGTSAPEMVVSAMSSYKGATGLALGNAVGSNIANVGLVLGIAALIAPLVVNSNVLKREYPVLMLVTVGAWIVLADGVLSRLDGFLLLGGLVLMSTWITVIGLKKAGSDPIIDEFLAEIPSDVPTPRAVMWLVTGMVVLPISSNFLVVGASNIAELFGVSELIIGLTIVALGTSLPELAATIASAIKGEHDIAIGNIIGSNMFNLLGVLGISGVIMPTLEMPDGLLVRDYGSMMGFTILLFLFSYGFRGPGRVSRLAGLVLLLLYLSYQLALIDIHLG